MFCFEMLPLSWIIHTRFWIVYAKNALNKWNYNPSMCKLSMYFKFSFKITVSHATGNKSYREQSVMDRDDYFRTAWTSL